MPPTPPPPPTDSANLYNSGRKKRTHAKDELCPSSCAPPPSSHIYLQPHLAIFSSQCCCLFSYAIKGYYVMADPNEVRRPPGRQPHRSGDPAQPSPTLVNQAMCRAGLCCTALGLGWAWLWLTSRFTFHGNALATQSCATSFIDF